MRLGQRNEISLKVVEPRNIFPESRNREHPRGERTTKWNALEKLICRMIEGRRD